MIKIINTLSLVGLLFSLSAYSATPQAGAPAEESEVETRTSGFDCASADGKVEFWGTQAISMFGPLINVGVIIDGVEVYKGARGADNWGQVSQYSQTGETLSLRVSGADSAFAMLDFDGVTKPRAEDSPLTAGVVNYQKDANSPMMTAVVTCE